MMRRAVCLYHRIYINARVCCSRWFTDGVKGIHHRLHRCGLWRHRYPQIGEDIVVYPCPPKTVSVLSVVQKTLCDEERSECARVAN